MIFWNNHALLPKAYGSSYFSLVSSGARKAGFLAPTPSFGAGKEGAIAASQSPI